MVIDSIIPRRHVLVVDDQEINRELLGSILEDSYDVLYASDGEEALSLIKEKNASLSAIFLDLLMPKIDGFQVLTAMKDDPITYGKIPVLVLTSEKDAELRALQLGASDFITKPYDMPAVILARVQRIIELREGRDLIQTAGKDALTGLNTANFFFQFAEKSHQYNPDLEMDACALNIERFRSINELYGMEIGNKVLCVIADTLKNTEFHKKRGIAGRGEADQYYFYFPHSDDYQPLLDEIHENINQIGKDLHVRMRLGICPPSSEISLMTRFDRAKSACNMLRNNFKTSILVYDDEMHQAELHDERLTNDIDRAVTEEQFLVYFQPKYDILSNPPHLRSAEALIRWKHPEFGMISPGEFIPLFERNGQIHIADKYVWKKAAEQIKIWKEKLGFTLPISVNLSRVEIFDPSLEATLMNLLKDNGLTSKDILLEVTETAYTDDAGQLISIVEDLRKKGFQIEMDDFGAGYSSLNMLSRLPIDALKMDMSFIRNIHKGNKDHKMVELILDIAEYMEVPVIAEGVETDEQLELLKEAGCDLAQGYYFSRPVPPEEFEQLIQKEIALRKELKHDS